MNRAQLKTTQMAMEFIPRLSLPLPPNPQSSLSAAIKVTVNDVPRMRMIVACFRRQILEYKTMVFRKQSAHVRSRRGLKKDIG